MAQVSYGTITITDTNDINRIYVEYCRSTSNQLSGSTVPGITVNWSESTPAWVDGQYLWQRAVIEKSGTLEKTYGTPVCITGAQGETGSQGSTGAAGRSLTSTTTQYTTAATNATITQSNMGNYTWSSNVPTYNSSTPAYWVRITNVYSNPSSTEYIIYKDNGITDAVKTSHDANTTASAANTTANSANTTANNANTKADNAVTSVNNLQNKLKYYWVNEVAHTNGVSGWTKPNYPAGTYAASGISGTTFDAENSSTYGYNTWYANGINLRYNAIKLGELTGSALTFYQPSTTTQGAKAMELSGTALKFYASNGITIQAEFGGSKAQVSGTINAYDGQIGNSEDNYWYIGNYLDYFENQSAIIKSHGTASIQLGDSNTWRIATNRIHTAWNNDSSSGDAFKLHFPVYDNKYWDSGLHLPTSANDKLLYIRNSSSSNTLTYLNEALEDQYTNRWNYLFYITNSGSIYAKNIYVLDDNGQATQIGGTDGVYLLKSGGTITGDLTVNGTLTGTLSGTATRVSKDLKIQLNGGTTEGTNQFTYNGGTAKTINITKSSVGLSNVENTALSTWAGSSNLTTTKVGTLAAAAIKGVDTSLTTSTTSTNLPTSAAVVNLIKQYLPLTGGNVTGAVTFGSSVSADELTVGDLVVNGAASFTNNLQANTINGVTVGSNPKFTDANVTQTATTGAYAYEVLFSYTADNTTRTEGARKTSTFTYNPNTKALVTGGTVNGYTLAAASAKRVVTSIDTSADLPTSNAVKTFVEGKNYVTSSGVTKVSTGAGLTGGDITGTGTVKANLRSETKLTRDSAAATETANRIYPVVLDKTGYLAVNVPWTNVNSSYLTGITSSDVTTALGYTPYNGATNPNGYITANHTSTYSLPVAKYNTLGGVKPAYSSTGAVSLTTAAATNTTTPTIAAKTTTSGRYYAVEIDKNGVLFVNVPWTNVNSSYLTSSSTLNWNNITQNKPTTASGYGITDAITNVSATSASGGSTTFTLTKSNGTTSTFDVVVYASAASQATDANYLTDGTTRYSVGNAKKPIYFDGGIPKASDGTEGTSTKPVYLSSGTITAGSTYAGGTKVTLNNSDKGASTASFYAPTSGGTSTQVLIGNGTTSAPVWTSISSLVPTNAGAADAFSSAATVALTGDTTGSASSTKGWSIATTTKYITNLSRPASADYLTPSYLSKVHFCLASSSMTTHKPPAGDGYITTYHWDNSGWAAQFYLRHNKDDPSPMVRGAVNNSSNTSDWGEWKYILTEANYTNYTVTKTGLGASGTWGIDITGNAATATKATQDSDGNTINTTYLKKTTYEYSKELSFGSSGKLLIGKFQCYDSNVTIHIQSTTNITYNAIAILATQNINTTGGGTFTWEVYGDANNKVTPNLYAKYASGSDFIEIYFSPSSWSKNLIHIQCLGLRSAPINLCESVTAIPETANRQPTNMMVTKTGTGASGTWEINITGNSTSATKANLTTTANAVAYYTDTAGTFGSKATANGALYATSANGALTFGTLPAAQGGTGKTTLKDACNALINALDTGSSNLTSNDYVITQYVGGGTTTTTYHRRPASALRVGGLLTARKLKVALSSTTDKTFDGTADVTDIPISGTLSIGNGGTGATTAANARTNLGLGSAATASTTTSIASGGTGLPTAGTVYTYVTNAISGASNTYVTIATDQTITANQKTFNGAIRWGTASKYGAAHYDSTLEAIVFSFA